MDDGRWPRSSSRVEAQWLDARGVGKRRVATEGTRGAVKFVPMLASEPAVVAEVVVHVGEVDIEVRGDRVSAQWLAQLVSEIISAGPKT